jgi:hypothetical protein
LNTTSHLQSSCFTAWAIPPVYFSPVILDIGVSWTSCLACLELQSSQLARSEMSHQCPFFLFLSLLKGTSPEAISPSTSLCGGFYGRF